MSAASRARAPSGVTWDGINWAKVQRQVRRLQTRMVKALQAGRHNKVKALQWLLTHSFSGRASAVKRVTENQGRNTAGVDKVTWKTPAAKTNAIASLKRRGYSPLPLRRVLIPKKNGKTRPLGIPVMKCRAMQAFSSRKLARKLHEDVAFRVLAAGNYPAHRTLCDFRAFHLKELSELFVQVVKLAKECGLVKLGTIAVDGTKIKANASRHKAMSYERIKKAELELKEQIDALLAKAKVADDAEKNEPELDIPAEITRREERLAVIRAARARLEERQRQASGRYRAWS